MRAIAAVSGVVGHGRIVPAHRLFIAKVKIQAAAAIEFHTELVGIDALFNAFVVETVLASLEKQAEKGSVSQSSVCYYNIHSFHIGTLFPRIQTATLLPLLLLRTLVRISCGASH